MHYIRLLRPLSLDKKDKLKLVLTITTDLGDSFLCATQPVPLSVSVHHSGAHQTPAQSAVNVKIDNGSIIWRSGLRVLKLELQLPAHLTRKLTSASGSTQVRISASRNPVDAPNIADIPFDTEGRILGISVPFKPPGQEICYTATREFRLPPTIDGLREILRINEEIGESIDRHVWDAGVVTTGLLFEMCGSSTSSRWQETPLLRGILTLATSECPLNVIELGCGVGILGIGLATALSARISGNVACENAEEDEHALNDGDTGDISADADGFTSVLNLGTILLTDLPDAEELTTGNIIGYQEMQSGSGPFQLAFESLDWEDGKNGVLGPKARTGWDLVIISDCTYNVDMLASLVATLSVLYKSSVALGKTGPKVMLATKPRHSSEKALFDLMLTEGWNILEDSTRGLPLLGLDDERVEIYLFGKA